MQHRVMPTLTNRICFWTLHDKEHEDGSRPLMVTALSHERSSLCYEAYANVFQQEKVVFKHQHRTRFNLSRNGNRSSNASLISDNTLACSRLIDESNTLAHRQLHTLIGLPPLNAIALSLSHFQTLTTSYNMWVATVLAFSNFQLSTWNLFH